MTLRTLQKEQLDEEMFSSVSTARESKYWSLFFDCGSTLEIFLCQTERMGIPPSGIFKNFFLKATLFHKPGLQ